MPSPLETISTSRVRWFQHFSLILLAYRSYLKGPDVRLYPLFMVSYRKLFSGEKEEKVRYDEFVSELQTIYTTVLEEFEEYFDLDKDSPHLDRIKNVLKKIINSDITLDLESIPRLDRVNKKDKQAWAKWLYNFFDSEDTLARIFDKLESQGADITEYRSQYKIILHSAYQEFYHAISHLFITKEDTKTGVHRSINHLQRASLDLIKIGIYTLKKVKNDVWLAVDCRSFELQKISKNDKEQMFTCYNSHLSRFVSET